MLIRKWMLEAGQASLPTPSDFLALGFPAAIAIGSLKVRIVCDQCVLGVNGEVERMVDVSLQNRLVKPVSNHKTTP